MQASKIIIFIGEYFDKARFSRFERMHPLYDFEDLKKSHYQKGYFREIRENHIKG